MVVRWYSYPTEQKYRTGNRMSEFDRREFIHNNNLSQLGIITYRIETIKGFQVIFEAFYNKSNEKIKT